MGGPSPVIAAWAYLAGAVVGVWFTKQARRPVALPRLRAIPSFFAGWLTNELAFHHLAWQLVATVLWIALGALGSWPGWVALALTVVQWGVLVAIIRDAAAARRVIAAAVDQVCPGGQPAARHEPQLAWSRLVVPLPRHPQVASTWHQRFARVSATDLRLDVHRRVDHADRDPAPVLLYVHGGAWVIGHRERQGLPLLYELAARGWVCVSADHRLSPFATWPEHVVDVKRALAWIRTHADDLGADPSFVAIAGGSAGAHLATVAALTAGDPELQPGFEAADTSVQAAVPFYGIYDFVNRHGFREQRFTDWVSRWVVKADPDEAPGAYRTASPLDLVHPDAPPFLVVHGDKDSLTPIAEAQAFVAALGAVSRAPVALAELPGAQHGFDIFPSLRTARVVHGVTRFLTCVHEGHRAGG